VRLLVEPIPFFKMNGCGNDFILIDSRSAQVPTDLAAFTRSVCRRKLSVGADGLILIEPSDRYDFQWQFYNSDGSRAEMCGNGARCAARFAHEAGIAGEKMIFKTDAGPIEAEMRGEQVKLKMTPPLDCRIDFAINVSGEKQVLSSINTGVPHVVLEQDGWPTRTSFRWDAPSGIMTRLPRPAPTSILFFRPKGSGFRCGRMSVGWRMRPWHAARGVSRPL
jgi:diaminopimelate epimerase